jgi:hypothetical protein
MKARTIIASVAVPAAMAVSAFGATAASASTGPSNGQTTQQTGGSAANYQDPVFGHVKCNETQHPKFDTVGCTFLDGQGSGGYQPGQTYTVGWNSDFLNSGHQTGVLTFTITTDSAGNVTGYSGQATYPNG